MIGSAMVVKFIFNPDFSGLPSKHSFTDWFKEKLLFEENDFLILKIILFLTIMRHSFPTLLTSDFAFLLVIKAGRFLFLLIFAIAVQEFFVES